MPPSSSNFIAEATARPILYDHPTYIASRRKASSGDALTLSMRGMRASRWQGKPLYSWKRSNVQAAYIDSIDAATEIAQQQVEGRGSVHHLSVYIHCSSGFKGNGYARSGSRRAGLYTGQEA